jgi:hypothetical protein
MGKQLMTPSTGTPLTDPAYMHRLQNPDAYGGTSTHKLISMMSSKVQWSGKRSNFDELKRLLEGHFEGHGASYLVNHCFLEKYETYGFKAQWFFPRIQIKPEDLEKQIGTLYGCLKQICHRDAVKALIQKRELRRDGMRTWLDLLKCYDNMGSNDVMTLHYDAVIGHHFHSKYPGGLEQFVTDYEEAYSKLEGIGEDYPDSVRRCKILANLYDGTAETKILVDYCYRNCKTFESIIVHLTDTHVRDAHYHGMRSARQAKLAQTTVFDADNDSETGPPDVRTILQSSRDQPRLSADYRIPTKAWDLLPDTAREAFLIECNHPLRSDSKGETPMIPKQYGGAGHDETQQAKASITTDIGNEDLSDSDGS